MATSNRFGGNFDDGFGGNFDNGFRDDIGGIFQHYLVAIVVTC